MSRIATERVYRNEAGEYCTADDPTVAVFIVGPGGELPDDYPTEVEKVVPADVPEKVEAAPTPKKKRT